MSCWPTMRTFRQAYLKFPVDALTLAWLIDHSLQAIFRLSPWKVLHISCSMGQSGFALYVCLYARKGINIRQSQPQCNQCCNFIYKSQHAILHMYVLQLQCMHIAWLKQCLVYYKLWWASHGGSFSLSAGTEFYSFNRYKTQPSNLQNIWVFVPALIFNHSTDWKCLMAACG